MKDEIRTSKNSIVDKIHHTSRSRPNHGSLDETQDNNTSQDKRNETLIISENATLYGPDSDEVYQKVSGENGPKSGPDKKNTDEVLDWGSEPDRYKSKVTSDIPYSDGTLDDPGNPDYDYQRTASEATSEDAMNSLFVKDVDTNEKGIKSQSLEEADGLIMNALQLMIQSIKDQNSIIQQQIQETSQMGAVIEDLRQETKTRQAKLDAKIADIDKLTSKINVLTQRVGDVATNFQQEAQTRQEILEDKIDGLEDKLITRRTHGAEESGEPGWRVGETQPLNPKFNTPRKNTKGENENQKQSSTRCRGRQV